MYIEEFISLTMKHSFAALAWLIAMSVYGQSDWDPSFGVSLGTNLSHTSSVFDESIALNLTEVDNNKLGLAAGVFCKWNEAKKISLFTEMNYTQKVVTLQMKDCEAPSDLSWITSPCVRASFTIRSMF